MDNEREKMLKWAWDGMKPWERFMVLILTIAGVLMTLSGIAMCICACWI